MNTRIQVEHPVTEMVYGIDLVKEQIRIAAGEPLGYAQSDLVARGSRDRVPINAEDPRNNFAPAAGTVSKLVFPGGPGIRVDTHLYAGATIPPYYDSMLAKIVAFGDTREAAIARMERALRETLVEGVHTTIELCLEILAARGVSRRALRRRVPSATCSLSVGGAEPAMTSRRAAREQALQVLYSVVIGDREPRDALREIVGESADSEQRAFVKELVLGTLEYAREADRIVSPLLEGWALERLPTIDRLLLEMATFELHCRPETPAAVAINEAVELAKRFSTEDSGRFVNGVLSAVANAEDVDASKGDGGFWRGLARRAADARAVRRRIGRRHRRGLRAQPARHQPHGRLPAGELDAHLRARRHAARLRLQGKSRLGADRAHPAARAQRVHRQRRSQLLPASRRRFRRHRARRVRRSHAPAVSRRLDDHAAARAAALSQRSSLAVAQSARSAARDRDRALLHQGRDPRALSQHHLPRRGRVRRRRGGAHLFRPRRR